MKYLLTTRLLAVDNDTFLSQLEKQHVNILGNCKITSTFKPMKWTMLEFYNHWSKDSKTSEIQIKPTEQATEQTIENIENDEKYILETMSTLTFAEICRKTKGSEINKTKESKPRIRTWSNSKLRQRVNNVKTR